MKRTLVVLSILLTITALTFAQSEPPQRQPEQFGPTLMKCPMMEMMSNMREGKIMGNMKEMMQGMRQRMANMFALSSEEIAALLGEKKSALGLSDSQVKQVADVIASSQQRKSGEKMQHMMAHMRAGEMACPCCMQPSAK